MLSLFRSKKEKTSKSEIITTSEIQAVSKDCSKLILDNSRWEASFKIILQQFLRVKNEKKNVFLGILL